jgi:hypothetical protein
MSNEIAKLVPRTEVPATNVSALPSAVEQVLGGLKEAISAMGADDISIELTASQETNRSTAHFSLRAYRKGAQILSEDRDV